MQKKLNKYLLIYALVATAIAALMVYNTVRLVKADGIVEYQKEEAVVCPTLQEQLSTRANELREENKNMDLERYRQEAIREVNTNLQGELNNSPFISYEELEAKYGY